MENTTTPLESIMALFEEIKLDKHTKAGNKRNRNRLAKIKHLITDAKKQLLEADKAL